MGYPFIEIQFVYNLFEDSGNSQEEKVMEPSKTLADKVYITLKEDITSGKLEPGTPLREEVVAKQFETSRTPVRQALQALQSEGLVQIEPSRGARVSEVSLRETLEVYEIRELLEPHAAFLAAQRRTPEHIAKLKEFEIRLLQLPESKDMKERMVLTMEFHSFINEIGGNKVLAEMVQNLRARTLRAFARISRAYYPRSKEEHLNLLRAIVAGDSEEAKRLSEYHLRSSKTEWMIRS